MHQQKCYEECNQCVTQLKKKSPKDYSAIEMVPIASGTKPGLNTKIQKAFNEIGIYQRLTKTGQL